MVEGVERFVEALRLVVRMAQMEPCRCGIWVEVGGTLEELHRLVVPPLRFRRDSARQQAFGAFVVLIPFDEAAGHAGHLWRLRGAGGIGRVRGSQGERAQGTMDGLGGGIVLDAQAFAGQEVLQEHPERAVVYGLG